MLKDDLDEMINSNEETRQILEEEHAKTLAQIDQLPTREEVRRHLQESHTETIQTLEEAHAYLVKSRDFVEKHPDLYD